MKGGKSRARLLTELCGEEKFKNLAAAYGELIGEHQDYENPWEVIRSLRKYIGVLESRNKVTEEALRNGQLGYARRLLKWGIV